MIGAYPVAATPIAGAPSYDDGTAFVLLVSGVDQSGKAMPGGLKWTQSLSGIASAHVTFWDKAKTWHPVPGEPVELHLGAELVFAGSVEEVTESQDVTWDGRANQLRIKAVGSERIASRYVVAKNYEVEGQTLKSVIQDAVDVQTPMGTEDGVQLLMADEDILLDGFVSDYETLRAFLDKLVRQTGHSWRFTPSGDLVVEPLGQTQAPADVSDANPIYRNLKLVHSRKKYRNKQYLRAGAQKTRDQSDSFKGDGETKTFVLRFAVDNDPEVQKPTFKVDDVAVASALVGISGADDEEEFAWLYQVGEKEVNQGSEEDPLSSGQKLSVDYTGQVSTIILEENEDQKQERQSVEGGSGLYEHVEEDDELVDRAYAVERTEGFLRRFGKLSEVVTFDTKQTGFLPGHLVQLNLSDHGINKQFLIQSVMLRDRSSTFAKPNLWWEVQAASPPEEMESWVEFFTRWFSGKKIQISRTNQKVLIIRKKEEQISFTDTVTEQTGASVEGHIGDPDTADPYTAAIMGEIDSLPSMAIGYALIGEHEYQK